MEVLLAAFAYVEHDLWAGQMQLSEDQKLFMGSAFVSAFFNSGGFLLHYVPNAAIGFFFGAAIEWLVGPLNMSAVVLLSYWASVFAVYVDNDFKIIPNHFRGSGFSRIMYQWFTVFFASLFLRYWFFPYLTSKSRNLKNAVGYWLPGILLLVAGPWMPFLAILSLRMIIVPELHVNESAHIVALLEGYGVSLVLALLMWLKVGIRPMAIFLALTLALVLLWWIMQQSIPRMGTLLSPQVEK